MAGVRSSRFLGTLLASMGIAELVIVCVAAWLAANMFVAALLAR